MLPISAKTLHALPLLFTALFLCLANAADLKLQKPPLSQPFNLATTGAYSFQTEIKDAYTYQLALSFSLHPFLDYKEIPPLLPLWNKKYEETSEDSQKLYKLLGGGTAASQWKQTGVPATFRVQILQHSSPIPLFDKAITNPETNAEYGGRYTYLFTDKLTPGRYSIHVQYLQGDPSLAPIHALLTFRKSPPPK